ncbi:MAG: NAD(P)H-dependent oxidoreductase [Alphaproteobacteria bacterium]|nr:NAD(P)H-dependent oxidoreductase [Alphaproteobacteria bacterium]MBQ9235241.1 NAD(P)H-dependent oxidoreductase [Alphaproteobacteria bacterium]
MNKYIIFGAIAALAAAFGTYRALANTSSEKVDTKGKVLIAYYSYSGNTKKVAQAINAAIGGDLFEITAEGSYPQEYRPMTQQAKEEIANGYRPKLTSKIDNIEQYDIVFIGSPNWWGTITPQVSSFIDSYKLAGKTVIPFITHGSGGVQNTIADMTAQCKDCHVIKDGWVGYSDRTMGLKSWLKSLGFAVE